MSEGFGSGSDALAASVASSLLPAALAETPDALADSWSAWLRHNHQIERLSGLDYRLLPQVWPRVIEHGIERPFSRLFDGVQKRVWTRNNLLVNEAASIQEQLDAAGIQSVLIKGSSLLCGVYKNIGHRPTGDIDLLVSVGDFRRAVRLMLGDRPNLSCDAHAAALNGRRHFVLDLHRYASQQSLARRSVESAPGAIEDIVLARRIETTIGQAKVMVPEPTIRLFLHLVNVFAHGARHNAAAALWLADTQACLRADDIDFASFADLVVSQDAVALFQHHFRAFSPFMPTVLSELSEVVLGLPQGPGAQSVTVALAALERRHRDAPPEDVFRAQWFALRGVNEADAPASLRLRYIAECGANVGRVLSFSPASFGTVLRSCGHYFRRTVSAISG